MKSCGIKKARREDRKSFWRFLWNISVQSLRPALMCLMGLVPHCVLYDVEEAHELWDECEKSCMSDCVIQFEKICRCSKILVGFSYTLIGWNVRRPLNGISTAEFFGEGMARRGMRSIKIYSVHDAHFLLVACLWWLNHKPLVKEVHWETPDSKTKWIEKFTSLVRVWCTPSPLVLIGKSSHALLVHPKHLALFPSSSLSNAHPCWLLLVLCASMGNSFCRARPTCTG